MNAEQRSPSFGEYLEYLRKARGRSLRKTADAIGVSPSYYCMVENGQCLPMTEDRIKAITEYLDLSQDEENQLYDLASVGRKFKPLPEDCSTYAQNTPYVVEALRMAKEVGAGEEIWLQMIEELKKRKG